jgi:hypothetical protein
VGKWKFPRVSKIVCALTRKLVLKKFTKHCSLSRSLHVLYQNACTRPGKWMGIHMCVNGTEFASFYDFSNECWSCSDSILSTKWKINVIKDNDGRFLICTVVINQEKIVLTNYYDLNSDEIYLLKTGVMNLSN